MDVEADLFRGGLVGGVSGEAEAIPEGRTLSSNPLRTREVSDIVTFVSGEYPLGELVRGVNGEAEATFDERTSGLE